LSFIIVKTGRRASPLCVIATTLGRPLDYQLKQAVEPSKSRRTRAEATLQGGMSLPTKTTRQL
jgi:hypothetical protein